MASLIGAAQAQVSGIGGSDNQIWIDSMGPDVTYFTEPLDFYLPSGVTGDGSTAGVNTTNNPPSGGIYYNTNSSASALSNGTAYEESGEGNDYFFTNCGSVAETVTMSWQGFVTSSATATGTGYSWDYASSYLLDGGTNKFAFNADFLTTSNGVTSGTNSGSGDYTITIAAGQEYVMSAEAYNEAYATTTPEPSTFAVFGLGLSPLLIRRRKSKSSSGDVSPS